MGLCVPIRSTKCGPNTSYVSTASLQAAVTIRESENDFDWGLIG